MYRVVFWFCARARNGSGIFRKEMALRVVFPEEPEDDNGEILRLATITRGRKYVCRMPDEWSPSSEWRAVLERHARKGWALVRDERGEDQDPLDEGSDEA
jgi:hypothetical protein